jgi:hypothetical protein
MLQRRFVMETFCYRRHFVTGDVLLRRRFETEMFCMETFCEERFCMFADFIDVKSCLILVLTV